MEGLSASANQRIAGGQLCNPFDAWFCFHFWCIVRSKYNPYDMYQPLLASKCFTASFLSYVVAAISASYDRVKSTLLRLEEKLAD